jgi:integrase
MSRVRLRPEDVTKAIQASTGNPKMTKISDGQSLYLITRNGRGYWSYNWREGASFRTKLLGNAPEMSPARARAIREELATERRNGRTVERRGAAVRRANPKPAEPTGKLFGEVVTEYLEGYWLPGQPGGEPVWMPGIADSWRGGLEGDEAKSYRRTLLKRGGIALRPVALINTFDVQRHLAEWNDRPVTREKVRSRIQTTLDNAKSRGFRDGDNPASTEIFKHLPRPKAEKVEHHPAMASADVPAFMVDLLEIGTVAARALAFTILTVARTDETIAMRWREVDHKNKVWIVPPERMKENEEHRVPLTPQAFKVMGKPGAPDDHVFPSPENGPGAPMWSKGMRDLLVKMHKRGKVKLVKDRVPVPHGFRTTFKGDWALKNGFPLELREMALAHAVGDAVVQAYSLPAHELYKVRIPMMTKWAKFVLSKVR